MGGICAAALTLSLAACSSASAGPQPAGPNPSPIAVEVCSTKAQTQVDEVFQLTSTVSPPTWADHLYSCAYKFQAGVIGLSVKELSSQAETTAYYQGLQAKLGQQEQLPGLGQGGFVTTNGSVVVRKDWKVLVVDQTRFNPALLDGQSYGGTPAELVASVIMGCWAGD